MDWNQREKHSEIKSPLSYDGVAKKRRCPWLKIEKSMFNNNVFYEMSHYFLFWANLNTIDDILL